MTDTTNFQYQKLNVGEFRLLRLVPGVTIRCKLIHESVHAPPNYTAISYAWGDSDDTTEIELDSCSVSITSSLRNGLAALWPKSEAILLWVDALCINQQDKPELSQQVQIMAKIYSQAQSVAIWLGPESDDSALVLQLLSVVAHRADFPTGILDLLKSPKWQPHFRATVDLFERDYWRRLWVVQEVLNAKEIVVYCGNSKLPWETYASASKAFQRHRSELTYAFPIISPIGTRSWLSQQRIAYVEVLSSRGPASLRALDLQQRVGPGSFLLILRTCRKKLTNEPRDKVYGVLGIQPGGMNQLICPDYSSSVTNVYRNVVESLLKTTRKLDIICDAIHFPLGQGPIKLPSWVPNWSHDPRIDSLSFSFDFCASGTTDAVFEFSDKRRDRLQFSAIYLDTIERRGVALASPCSCDEPLMAFLHWRAKLHQRRDLFNGRNDEATHEAFCRTLCLDQASRSNWKKSSEWKISCYHAFGGLIRERLPSLPKDDQLEVYANMDMGFTSHDRSKILQDFCIRSMTGRRFYLTHGALMGLGSGSLDLDDEVCVPLGCKTPVILRPQGDGGKYRLIGDAYVDGYMYGEAINDWKQGKLKLKQYVCH